MKIVINQDYGGFGLSPLAKYVFDRKSRNVFESLYDIPRNHPVLVEVVERFGRLANKETSSLKVVEIPDDVDWVLQEEDGKEWVAERHRTWR